MKNTDTTAPAAEAATEDDETRANRERHVAIIDGLTELVDLLADAGPAADLTDRYTEFEMRHLIWSADRNGVENLRRLLAVATTLGAEIDGHENAETGATHYHAEKAFADGAVKLIITTIVDPSDVADAAAALAEALAEGGASL